MTTTPERPLRMHAGAAAELRQIADRAEATGSRTAGDDDLRWGYLHGAAAAMRWLAGDDPTGLLAEALEG